MTKKELIEMLSPLPDDAEIKLTQERFDLMGNSVYPVNINGYYENNGYYILSSRNVMPRIVTIHD